MWNRVCFVVQRIVAADSEAIDVMVIVLRESLSRINFEPREREVEAMNFHMIEIHSLLKGPLDAI